MIYRDENLKLYQTFSVTKELKCGSEYLREDAKMRKWYFTGYQDPENPEIYDYDEIIDTIQNANLALDIMHQEKVFIFDNFVVDTDELNICNNWSEMKDIERELMEK